MTLTIHCGALLIADGTVSGSVLANALVVDGQHLVDVVNNIGALGVVCFDRTTKSHVVQFDVEKQHGTPEAAIYHALMHRQTVPGTGALIITLTTATAVHQWDAVEAAWKSTSPEVNGISTKTSYEVECGRFTYEADPSEESVATIADDELEGTDGDTISDET